MIVSVASLLLHAPPPDEPSRAPRLAKTTEDITRAVEEFKGFGCVQTAQFSRWGRQVFAAWYCPFSGRAACYLHVYYWDHAKARWIRFVDRLVEHESDLSAEMPSKGELLLFRGNDGKIAVQESVAKFPEKKWYKEQEPAK